MEIYKIGSYGEVVRQIQKALKVFPDGIFGEKTREAVVEFQKSKGLAPDGIVGPATLALLIPARLKKSKRTIKEIIIHCTATPEGQDVTVEQIRRDHIKNHHWSDIGYHYVIYRNGHVEKGRDVDIAGAHCEGHNTYSIGVAYVGGLERDPRKTYNQLEAKDTRTLSQKAALLSLLVDVRKLYPNAKIISHRDLDKHGKQCPSFDATREYRNI